jgi:DNA-binding NarL/FixJ family response regulator
MKADPSSHALHSQRRLLLADDHEALRRGLASLLSSQDGWEVVAEAGDGSEALRLARETNPNIAIVDFELPEMDGAELTRAIRQELPRTEVVIYTMHDRDSIVVDTLRAGAKGYVLKSDSSTHLISALESLALRKFYFSPALSKTLLGHVHDPDYDHALVLTPREREVVKLIAEGLTNKQVAQALEVSVKTVETHRVAAMHKLNVTSAAQLVMYAVRNGLVQP